MNQKLHTHYSCNRSNRYIQHMFRIIPFRTKKQKYKDSFQHMLYITVVIVTSITVVHVVHEWKLVKSNVPTINGKNPFNYKCQNA